MSAICRTAAVLISDSAPNLRLTIAPIVSTIITETISDTPVSFFYESARQCTVMADTSTSSTLLEWKNDGARPPPLRQRSCGERRIGLHQTMSCRSLIPAYSYVNKDNVGKIYPSEAPPMSETERGKHYVAAAARR